MGDKNTNNKTAMWWTAGLRVAAWAVYQLTTGAKGGKKKTKRGKQHEILHTIEVCYRGSLISVEDISEGRDQPGEWMAMMAETKMSIYMCEPQMVEEYQEKMRKDEGRIKKQGARRTAVIIEKWRRDNVPVLEEVGKKGGIRKKTRNRVQKWKSKQVLVRIRGRKEEHVASKAQKVEKLKKDLAGMVGIDEDSFQLMIETEEMNPESKIGDYNKYNVIEVHMKKIKLKRKNKQQKSGVENKGGTPREDNNRNSVLESGRQMVESKQQDNIGKRGQGATTRRVRKAGMIAKRGKDREARGNKMQ
jgi:hypothetical protein